MKTRRRRIEGTVRDLVADLLYYDRKDDKELPRGEIDDAIAAGEISITELSTIFKEEIEAHISGVITR